jgi:hypothetical protein
MKQHVLVITLIASILAAASAVYASEPASKCADEDAVCKDFEKDLEAELPEKVVAGYNPARTYSDEALHYVGGAYLALASRENITPEQEEDYYQKALSVRHYVAYMGLYFFYARNNEEKALGFLREYVKTKPLDTVPYVLLGEAELNKKNYGPAEAYLREAKKVAHAHSPRVDWMLFQASYMLRNYAVAGELFESAVTKGSFKKELKALLSDQRFAGIEKRPEFGKYRVLLREAMRSN